RARPQRPRGGLLLAGLTMAGCVDRGPVALPAGAESDRGDVAGYAVVDRASSGPGERFTLALNVEDGLGAVQGWLRWDVREARYRGQIPEAGVLAMVNEDGADAGRLRIAAVAPNGFPGRMALLVFESARPGVPASLRFEAEVAGSLDAEPMRLRWSERVAVDAAVASAAEPRRLDWLEWAEWLDPDIAAVVASGPGRVPGAGQIWGDAFVSGTINVLDVSHIVNMVVGNQEMVLASDAPNRDAVVAGNVRPANLPGLGEPGDACPPGLEVCGGLRRVLNVLDALAIAQESLGQNQVVVGDPIPRPAPVGTAALSGTLTGVRTLSPDTVYTLQGVVQVGDEAGAAGELVVTAGTRIEAGAGAALVVTRNGRLHAEGTPVQPITFTCTGALNAGCWEGLVLNGNAPVNSGAGSSPALAGRSVGGCPEMSASSGAFGGCEPADSSGVLRWVRVEGAGGGTLEALALRGVGTGTVLSELFVARSGAGGIGFDGGTARAKRIRTTASAGPGLDWSYGWTGAVQFLVVQADGGAAVAVQGANSPSDPDAAPRSWPTLRNVSLVGGPAPVGAQPGSAAIRLTDGTAMTVVGALVHAQPDSGTFVLDIDGVETWAQLEAGTIRFDTSLVSGFGRLGDLDADPATTLPYLSPDAEGQFLRDLARGNRILINYDSVEVVLRGPWASVPDLRPIATAPMWQVACPSLAGDPFFEPAAYCGAVQPPSSSLGEVAWVEPAPVVPLPQVPLSPERAYLRYLVESPQLGPMPGVTLSGPAFGVTGLDGVYRSYTAAQGAFVTLGNLPAECTDPGLLILLPLAPREIRTTGVTLDCSN
ncbi:MAG: hypothetical protein KC645_19515, partial [Gemmatimonadetes bacterium]|nr:hypothetical protein [Gemmatimonadota bacterium]